MVFGALASLGLASGAPVKFAGGDLHQGNPRVAHPALLVLALIGVVGVIRPQRTGGVPVINACGDDFSIAYPIAHDGNDVIAERRGTSLGELVAGHERVDLAAEERFGAINIAHTSEQGLIHQGCADGSLFLGQAGDEFLFGCQRVGFNIFCRSTALAQIEFTGRPHQWIRVKFGAGCERLFLGDDLAGTGTTQICPNVRRDQPGTDLADRLGALSGQRGTSASAMNALG